MSFTQKQRGKIIAKAYKNLGIHDQKILDIGCGNGVVSKVIMEELGLDLLGTDIIDYRREKIAFKKMESTTELPFEDGLFDAVMFNDVLHHSNNIESLLNEGRRVGKKLLIFEVKASILFRWFDVFLNYFYSPQMPHPKNFKSMEEWIFLFKKLGFHYKKGEITTPIWYPFAHMAFKLTDERRE